MGGWECLLYIFGSRAATFTILTLHGQHGLCPGLAQAIPGLARVLPSVLRKHLLDVQAEGAAAPLEVKVLRLLDLFTVMEPENLGRRMGFNQSEEHYWGTDV